MCVLTIVFIFFSCKTSLHYTNTYFNQSVDSTQITDILAEKLIAPYRDSLEKEMNQVIAVSEIEMPKEKNKSETLLGNFVADLCYQIVTEDMHLKVDFCLLNNGGLRTSLPKGEITRGKIFELMPFDNELVIVQMTPLKAIEMLDYIKNVGGQPISGSKLDFTKSTEILLKEISISDTLNILTSDYLASGGDKMTFFLQPTSTIQTHKKVRDAIIEYCLKENKKGNQLKSTIDGRIQFNQ